MGYKQEMKFDCRWDATVQEVKNFCEAKNTINSWIEKICVVIVQSASMFNFRSFSD